MWVASASALPEALTLYFVPDTLPEAPWPIHATPFAKNVGAAPT
jgi:hypothetical protein